MKLNQLLHYLNEQAGLYEDIEEIANYPEGFNINEFKDQPSFAAKARYLKRFGLDKLGAGSSRAVFVADNDTVIKVAKNKKGLAQNKVESELSEHEDTDAPIAIVKDGDPDNFWIEAERARKAKPTDFKNIVGFPMEAVMKTVKERVDVNKGRRILFNPYLYLGDRELYKQISETDFVSDLVELIVSHDLATGDVNRISSWGVVARNGKDHLVLVDYGLDMDVFDRLYRR